MRKYVLSMFALLAVFGMGHYAKADIVFVTGNITSTTSWSPVHTYVINGNVTVNGGATVNIAAGTVVKMATSVTFTVSNNAVLNAQGSTTGTIYFTSIHDNTVGDNADGTTAAKAGDWKQITLNSGASSTIKYAAIRYGGNSNTAAIFSSGARLDLENSSITSTLWLAIQQQLSATATIVSCDLTSSSTHTAVNTSNSAATITSSTIHDNSVGINASGSGSLTLTGNTFTNNTNAASLAFNNGLTFTHSGNTGQGGFYITGPLATSQTFSADGLPYVISGVEFSVGTGKTLDISAGAVIKFGNSSSKLTASGANTVLRANGTSASSVYFTSIHDDAADGVDTDGITTSSKAGDWGRITVSTGASSTIAYAVIRYGDAGSTNGSLYNSSGNLTLSNSEVATSSLYNIYQDSGTSTISTSTIHNAGSTGIYASGGTVNVSSSNVHNNTSYGVYVTGATVNISSTQTHDQSRGLYIGSGTLSVTSSDIFSNSWGVRYGGGSLTLAENAIHGNTSAGVYNDTATLITANGNWWGASTSPGTCDTLPGGTGNCSDATSSNITVNTWHHEDGRWAARNLVMLYNSSTKYSDQLTEAVSDWNSSATGMGVVTVSSTVASTTGVLIIKDYTDSSNPGACGFAATFNTASSLLDIIQFNTYCMDSYIQTKRSDVTSTRLAVVRHELGHELGLGHSMPVNNDVMWNYWDTQVMQAFGPEDKSDYNFLWNTTKWATPLIWPQ